MSGVARCPDCRVQMREVSARARTGYLLALDQCGGCGGLWFDRWELFPLHHEEVVDLDTVDLTMLDRSVGNHASGDCPRCEVGLRDFRDSNLPSDARVARCHVCEGMWLQRGQLRIVKRAASDNARTGPVEDAELRALVETYGDKADWARVKHLDNATYEHEEAPPRVADIGQLVESSLPWLVLHALFRLLTRR